MNPRQKRNTERRYSHINFLTLMSPSVIGYLFISCSVGVQLFVFVAGNIDCSILLSYISLSLCSPKQTRSIALGGCSATKKEPRVS